MQTIKNLLLATTLLAAAANTLAGPGLPDPAYAPNLNGPVSCLAIQPDGRLVIGGSFTSVNSTSRNRIARLYGNGALDTSFLSGLTGASGNVNALVIQPDGRIVIGGVFTSVNNTTRVGIARLNPNGTVDGSFVPGNYSSINAVAVQSDNKVILGGGNQPGYVYRLNADGSFDSTFTNYSSSVNGPVYAVAVQADGKVVIGGSFSSFSGIARGNVARLNTDGSLDTGFLNGVAGANGPVNCLQVQADGKVLIGGTFSSVNGTGRARIARLTSTGTLETGFGTYSGVTGTVYAMAIQPDGSIVIGGSLTCSFYLSGVYYYSYDVARLYADGTMDTSFAAPRLSFATTYGLAVQSDGKVLVGGNFVRNPNSFLSRSYGNTYPPEFISQPTNQAVRVGTNVTFSALVSNPTPTYFQWRKNGADISGATGMSYSLYNVQLGDAGTYSVFANNAAGGVTSTNAVLQVGIAPVITQQPVSLVVTQGQTATLTVAASGAPLNYFWKKNGTLIPGATNASLTFASTVFTNAGSYTCLVSNFLGNVTSSAATLTVYAPPTILVQPSSRTVGVSSNFTVSVLANGTTPLTYQWLKDGVPFPSVASFFTVTNAQTGDSGGYSVVITNSLGSVTSEVATVSVIYFPATFLTQPVGGAFQVGSNFILSASVGGSAPFSYQWNFNDVPIGGANGDTYTVNNAQTNDSGAYTLVVTNLGGSVTSSVAMVNVGYAPVILLQPMPFTNSIGSSNAFGVTVFGSEPLAYQWYKDSLAIPEGTNSQLLLPSLQTNQIGYYAVAVTNIYGGTFSSNALLTISDVPLPFQWIGLLAYYPFNGDATDASGHGFTGVTNGGTAFATDRFGNTNAAAGFDGLSGYVSINDPSANLTFDARSNSYSLVAWVKLNATNADQTILIDRGTTQSTQPSSYGLLYTASMIRFRSDIWDGNRSVGVTNAVPPGVVGRWYMLAMVMTNGVSKIYVDGADVTMPYVNGGVVPSGFGTTKNTEGIRDIGRFAGGSFTDYFNGTIDDVRIYNRALSSNEVVQLYMLGFDLPVIITQPQSQTIVQGGTAALTVSATAASPLTYQWSKDGAALTGATNATLVISNVQPNLAGNYTVAVSNLVVGVVSSPAMLAVLTPIANTAPSYVSNQFGFNVSGTPGSSFVVESSTNLQAWQPLFTNVFGTNAFPFVDPGSATNPMRFYRTRY